jgi:hypothetical protein
MRRQPASMDAHDHDPSALICRQPFQVEAGNDARFQSVPNEVDQELLFLVRIDDFDAAQLVGGPFLCLDTEEEVAARRVGEGADVGEKIALVTVAAANRLGLEVEETALQDLVIT